MIGQGQTLYLIEIAPAGYAAICANEAEKAAPVHLMEVITFGAVGRPWFGGNEAEIAEARRSHSQHAGRYQRPRRRLASRRRADAAPRPATAPRREKYGA